MARLHLSDSVRAAVLSAGVCVVAAGCGSSDERSAKQLTADQFVTRAASVPPDGGRLTGAPVESGGAVRVDGVSRFPKTPDPSADPIVNPQSINPTVDQGVRSPYAADGNAAAGPIAPTTTRVDLAGKPATNKATADAGGPRAVDVGFVVMEVNGKPIYSDKILSALERPLAAEAKKNNVDNFRNLAKELLEQQVQLYKRDELEVASADLSLSEADKQLAQALTAQWRQQQITAAGGSLEMARIKARDEGWEFEDLVQQQFRLKLVQIFYQKRIFPKIFVPPADQRAYYEQNKAKEFTQVARLKFRVIKIDPKTGFSSDGDAVALAQKVRERAKSEDFAKLADEINKDGRGGAIGQSDSGGWVDANSYRYEKVEKTAAQLKPGEVSDVILEENRLLFVVKLEAIQEGTVQAFEEPSVQERITQRLRGIQLQALREAHIRKLERDAVTRRNEGKVNDLLDIVMKKYPDWAKAG
ncbi:peptidyl-prolyl cis-trans isomerase [Humisphaera borealis]|uniref:Peptidyl-prolyl cis-trans isomerase n=1 Tax=Humisphaera borealis TaxID=2807512 RepID=A0A7M2WY84_9BACT|nr:peptidyl-prolyl cis-trans isomerase [Humisphaera borealis]QOV90435.1 peptidyl-prolyl cis-trans isomerase [Humisphaera borealis]